MLNIVLAPQRGKPGRYAATLADGRVLCVSRQPLFDGARVLLAESADPGEVMEARHEGSATVAMRSTVGEAAKWTIEDTDARGTRKRRWMPFRGGADRPPATDTVRPVGSCLAVLAALLGLLAPPAHAVTAKSADTLAGMVGINVHLGFKGTVYDTGWATKIRPNLLLLGARHIRDHATSSNDPTTNARWTDLAANGIRLDLVCWEHPMQGQDLASALNATSTVVEAAEPPNERDVPQAVDDWGSGWKAHMNTWMRTNYPLFNSDPKTSAVTLLGPAFANTRDSAVDLDAAFPGLDAFMDNGNLHDYSGRYPEASDAGGWGLTLPQALANYATLSNGKVPWITENGYKMTGAVPGHPVVTQRAAAKYGPRSLLAHYQLGVKRYYDYELINEASENFGILNTDGTVRPLFSALKNVITLFKDPGASFPLPSLNYTIAGDQTNVRSEFFAKRNGRMYLVLWQAVNSVNGGLTDGTATDIEPPAKSLVVSFGRSFTTVKDWKPSLFATARNTYANVSSVTVSVPDHIAVLELIP